MEINRRDFLRFAGSAAAVLGLSAAQLRRAEDALAATESPPVIWLSGSSCTGCTVSLLNAVNPTIDQVLLNHISLKYHPQLSTAAGALAVSSISSTRAAGGYVLVVEGAIPTAAGGKYCYVWDDKGVPVTMASAVQSLAANAAYLVAVGACASYGGIPGANSLTGSQGLGRFTGRGVINLPGCPAHPEWVVGTLVQVLGGSMPALDSNGRPSALYKSSQSLQERCPRRGGQEAHQFGLDGACLQELGCQGPRSHCDCDTRLWNNKQGYCIGVNGLCIGCTEPSFPAFPLHTNGD